MPRMLRALLLSLTMGLLTTASLPAAAQDTKSKADSKSKASKSDTGKSDDSKPASKSGSKSSTGKLGTIEIYEDASGKYRYRIKDEDDKVIAMPPRGYEKKEDVQRVLGLLKETLNGVKPTEVKDK